MTEPSYFHSEFTSATGGDDYRVARIFIETYDDSEFEYYFVEVYEHDTDDQTGELVLIETKKFYEIDDAEDHAKRAVGRTA